MIIVRNRELLIPRNEMYIGTTFDENSEVRVLKIDRAPGGVDIANLTFHLDLEYASGDKDTCAVTKEVLDHYILITWHITAGQLQVPGVVYINVRATDAGGDVKWASFRGALYVQDTINTPGSYSGDLSELEQLEQQMDAHLQDLMAYGTDAEKWATGGHDGEPVEEDEPQYENNAKYYAESVSAQAAAAAASATAAGTAQAAAEAAQSAAQGSATNAAASETGAYVSGQAAALAASNAEGSASDAKSWAVGGTGTRAGENTDNAKYYSQKAESAVSHYPEVRYVGGANPGYYWFVWDAETEQMVNTGVKADGGAGGAAQWGLITGTISNQADLKTALDSKYVKPGSGIPKADLATGVQASLALADSALQSHQDISGKENVSNKVTSMTAASTDTQYPSAKAVYDELVGIKSDVDAAEADIDTLESDMTGVKASLQELEDTVDSHTASLSDVLPAEYSTTATYNVGATCMHNGKMYVCNSNSVTGAWNPSYWAETRLGNVSTLSYTVVATW